MIPLCQFGEPDMEGKVLEGDREGFPHKGPKKGFCAGLAADLQRVPEPEFCQGMKTGHMVEVTMADEEEGGLLLIDIPIGFCNPVPGIKNDVPFIGLYQHRAGVSRKGIVPPVGPEKGDVHRDLIVADQAKKGAVSLPALLSGTMNPSQGDPRRLPAEDSRSGLQVCFLLPPDHSGAPYR